MMLSLKLTGYVNLNTDVQLDDGLPHDVTVTVSTTHVSLQVTNLLIISLIGR